MGKLKNQISKLAREVGGSFKTVHDREAIAERFADYLQQGLNIQIRDIEHLKSSHIEKYIEARLAEGIGLRTLQNEMAAIRAVLREAGRDKLAESERISNASLGLSGASRKGTKEAIPDEKFREVLGAAMERDRGVAACIMLERQLGLRAEEAVQADKSLGTWARQIEEGRERVSVVFGTKGDRPRETTVIDRERALTAIRFAKTVAAEGKTSHIIDREGLKEAMNRLSNVARAIGLEGKHSMHSLRYAYAQEAKEFHLQRGHSEAEAQALVSMDLGHGDGRGRYVERVYVRVV